MFGVLALCTQHTFQVLTKRPARMRRYFEALRQDDPALGGIGRSFRDYAGQFGLRERWVSALYASWPLRNL